MQRILAIALNDLRVYFSEVGNLIGLIALPVGLTLMLGLTLGGDGGTSTVFADVIDNDQSAESAQFIATIQQVNETLILCPQDNDEDNRCGLEDDTTLTTESSIERVRNSNLSALIVIPEGYGESVQQGERVQIEYYSVSSGTQSFSDPVLAAVQAAVQRANSTITVSEAATYAVQNFELPTGTTNLFPDEEELAAFSGDVRQRAEDILETNPVTVEYTLTSGAEIANSSADDGFGQVVPGQGATFVMFTVLGGMALLVRERKQWTLQRLIISPASRAQILAGKIIAYFTLGMIQFGVVFVVGILTGTDFGDDPIAIFAIMIAFVLATTSLGFLLSTFLTNEEQVGGLSLLLALTLAPLGGAWWPMEITPEFMQVIGHISPVAWAMDGFHEVIFFGGGFTDVLLPIGVLLGISAVFFGYSILNFRYE